MSYPEEKVTTTHAFSSRWESPGVTREATVRRGDNGDYGVSIRTQWANQLEPVETDLFVTPEGLDFVIQVLLEAAQNMDKYKLPEPGQGPQTI